jgi:cytochrome c-type biogenesis protein
MIYAELELSAFPLTHLVLVPLGLGLLGSIEPCSIGSTLIFIKYLEGKDAAAKVAEVGTFTVTRALLIGFMGILAAALGTSFFALQRAAWIVLGTIYILLGLLYLTDRAGPVMVSLGPGFIRHLDARGSALLGIVFGMNIPACAAPLIFALLAAAAAGGAAGATLASGFVSLAVFGLALSLPLAAVVLYPPARRGLDWLAGPSRRVRVWTGAVLFALGLWSVCLGLFADLNP